MNSPLPLLIELANISRQSERDALIEKQSLEIQQAFINQDPDFIKQKLFNNTSVYFNERAVVQFHE